METTHVKILGLPSLKKEVGAVCYEKPFIHNWLVNFASFEFKANVFILVVTKWKENNYKKKAQIW